MADGKQKLKSAYDDAVLETQLPARFTEKPGSVETPIARTARKNMLESAMGVQNAGKNADKYIGYADQEAREAAAEERRETSRMHPTAKKKGGKICGMKKGGKVRGCGIAERGLTKGKMR